MFVEDPMNNISTIADILRSGGICRISTYHLGIEPSKISEARETLIEEVTPQKIERTGSFVNSDNSVVLCRLRCLEEWINFSLALNRALDPSAQHDDGLCVDTGRACVVLPETMYESNKIQPRFRPRGLPLHVDALPGEKNQCTYLFRAFLMLTSCANGGPEGGGPGFSVSSANDVQRISEQHRVTVDHSLKITSGNDATIRDLISQMYQRIVFPSYNEGDVILWNPYTAYCGALIANKTSTIQYYVPMNTLPLWYANNRRYAAQTLWPSIRSTPMLSHEEKVLFGRDVVINE